MPDINHDHQNPDIQSFSERYGLHPLVAGGAIGLDTMLFGTLEAPSFELLAVISFFVGCAAILPFALIQMYAYKESAGAAWGKAILLGLLTAVPTPLPSLFTGAWGVMGFMGLAEKRARLRNGTPGITDVHNHDHDQSN